MSKFASTMRALCLSALLATSASPALARGKMDRAREAVAAARAKVDAAAKVSATGDVPRLQAEAAAALRTAEEDVASSRKDEAIAQANRASQLADTAIGISVRNNNAAANASADVAVSAQVDAANAQAAAADAQRPRAGCRAGRRRRPRRCRRRARGTAGRAARADHHDHHRDDQDRRRAGDPRRHPRQAGGEEDRPPRHHDAPARRGDRKDHDDSDDDAELIRSAKATRFKRIGWPFSVVLQIVRSTILLQARSVQRNGYRSQAIVIGATLVTFRARVETGAIPHFASVPSLSCLYAGHGRQETPERLRRRLDQGPEGPGRGAQTPRHVYRRHR